MSLIHFKKEILSRLMCFGFTHFRFTMGKCDPQVDIPSSLFSYQIFPDI